MNYWIYKDKPDIYLKSMERLGTNAEKTCIFEDSHIAICTPVSAIMYDVKQQKAEKSRQKEENAV